MSAERLDKLRAEMRARGLDALVVPHADEFQNEYLPPHAERLAYVTGFTGSAGAAVILADRAAVFVDGRYTIQAAREVPEALFERRHLIDEPPEAFLQAALQPGNIVGYDPWLHTPRQADKLRGAVEAAGGRLVATQSNLVDAIWTDQPAPPLAPILAHPETYAGETGAAKRLRLAADLRDRHLSAAILTDPSSIAWLLNVRGGDVPCTPLPLSFAILHEDGGVDWFVDARKTVGLTVEAGVERHAPEDFIAAFATLTGRTVSADPATAPCAVFAGLAAHDVIVQQAPDLCALPKACKTAGEMDGTRAAHLRDGAALVNLLAWLDGQDPGSLTELDVVARLESCRRASNLYRGPSFETIAGAGPNGAIVHYRVTQDTDRPLARDSFLLLDSGGQYLDGTTDITRTIPIGTPTPAMKAMFTRVLKGHIALATARFPRGTTGQQLDVLARSALWQVGANYDHGTGHGVGSYLSVHEGPQRIAPKAEPVPLRPGMIVSNEPGYYETGAYGIRIENLIAVREEGGMLSFETLSLAPIDIRALEIGLLSAEERAWLNAYHARVAAALSPLVDGPVKAWLTRSTRPV